METVTKRNDDYSNYKKLAHWNMEELIEILSYNSSDTPEFIKKAITRAIDSGHIKTISIRDQSLKEGVRIQPLSALKWAQDNDYHIPGGLIFYETNDGGYRGTSLFWGEKPKPKATYKWITGEQLLNRWQDVTPTDIVTIGQEIIYHTDDSGYNHNAPLLCPRRNPIDHQSTCDFTEEKFVVKGFLEGDFIENEVKQLYFSMKEIHQAEDEFPHLAEQAIRGSSMENPLSRDERKELEQLRSEKQSINRNEDAEDEYLPLTKTERQEFGRLKLTEERWSESLKAAVLIGHWIDTCQSRVIKSRIRGILANHFPDMKNKETVLAELWNSIPDNAKNSGSGSRNEPMPDNIWPDVNTEIKK
ncbi:hypothetical protein [Desulfocicer niacini]